MFEIVFAPLSPILRESANGSLHEWHFRTFLDHYSSLFGYAEIYVFLFVIVAQMHLFPLSKNGVCNEFPLFDDVVWQSRTAAVVVAPGFESIGWRRHAFFDTLVGENDFVATNSQ